jgi:signal transduction histidine kinase/ActR/RegA family two-component response regulator
MFVAVDSHIRDKYKTNILSPLLFSRHSIGQQLAEISKQKDKIEQQRNELECHRNNLEATVKERTADLERAKENAEESDRLKSAFLDNMSHEVRTPMNAIIGYLDFLSDPEFSVAEKKDFIKTIRSSGNILIQIIDDIMTMARIHSGQLEIIQNEVDLNKFFSDITAEFKIKIKQEEKPIEFKYILPQQHSIVYLDEFRLKQIINHILYNSLIFTDEGTINLSVKFEERFISFRVTDSGIGIQEKHIEHIFESFYKIEEGLKQFRTGAGLGLTIAKAIIDLHGGTIQVQSEYGKCSSITFKLPLIKKEDQDQAVDLSNVSQAPDKSDISVPLRKDKKILFVEDDDSSFHFIEIVLKPTRAQVTRATNGHDAIRLLEQESDYTIILMDLKMPQMNGIEATKRIRQIRPDIKIIAQTAYPKMFLKKNHRDFGFDNLLVKPINKDSILRMLEEYFNSAG